MCCQNEKLVHHRRLQWGWQDDRFVFVLPEMLGCKEFVNADEIARRPSPFQPETVAIQAGRIMLERIDHLLETGVDFAFETTLATRSHVGLVKRAQEMGYVVHLLFFWLNSPELAVERVRRRVKAGGHAIPETVVRRRYDGGLKNFFELFMPTVDFWVMVDNSAHPPIAIAEGIALNSPLVFDAKIWNELNRKYNGK